LENETPPHCHILNAGEFHFIKGLKSVEKKDSSVSNDTGARTPRQHAMNWFAACGSSFN
jgi:hypothetical protein